MLPVRSSSPQTPYHLNMPSKGHSLKIAKVGVLLLSLATAEAAEQRPINTTFGIPDYYIANAATIIITSLSLYIFSRYAPQQDPDNKRSNMTSRLAGS